MKTLFPSALKLNFSGLLSLFTCLFALSTGRPALCADTGGPPVLMLCTNAQVNSDGIFLHQLLVPGWDGPANLLVGPAPALTQPVVLTRAQIAAAVAKLDPTLVLTNWSGAMQVRVARLTHQLEENELKDLLTAALQREQVHDRGELELRFTRPWAPITVPDQPLTARILELPTAGVTPNFILRFELRAEKERDPLGNWQVTLQARIWRDILVARSSLSRGRLLREADLGTERRDILLLRDALPSAELAESNLELVENLAPGAPLLARSVHARPVIRRGKLLDAVIEDGPLMISVKAEAMEDGLPGQIIRVRNSKSKREFHGKVQDESTVVVAL